MSGYLELKNPFKSNLGLNPFKSWKRQWCILRPSGTCSGGSLAVYCSEAGASAGNIELAIGSVVRRAKSRSRPYAFAVFSREDLQKPRVLLAAQSLHEATLWMEKIRALLDGNKLRETETSIKESYSVTIVPTNLSRKCGLTGADGSVKLSCSGLIFSHAQQLGTFIQWKHVAGVQMANECTKNKICEVTVDSGFSSGAGMLKFSTPLASELLTALRQALDKSPSLGRTKLSKSEGDLRSKDDSDKDDVRRSSWYSGPSEVSLDDIDLVMTKESALSAGAPLSRCRGAGHLARVGSVDRRSLLSVASGIYEEIPELPLEGEYCRMSGAEYCRMGGADEPTYESVAECVYATMRRSGKRFPPPLPPRGPGSSKLWRGAGDVGRHCSLGSLLAEPDKLHKPDKRPFTVFRKRLKSDSRLIGSPKSDTKENKDVESKKKRFEFSQSRDLFKSFRVGRKMKNLKISSGLRKADAKSCEHLEEANHEPTTRSSKSVECLETDNFNDISFEFNNDVVTTLALPQDILDLIYSQNKIRLKESPESEYMPMSPLVPPAMEQHYIVMAPRSNTA